MEFLHRILKKKPSGRELGQKTLKLQTERLLKGTLDKLIGFFSNQQDMLFDCLVS